MFVTVYVKLVTVCVLFVTVCVLFVTDCDPLVTMDILRLQVPKPPWILHCRCFSATAPFCISQPSASILRYGALREVCHCVLCILGPD